MRGERFEEATNHFFEFSILGSLSKRKSYSRLYEGESRARPCNRKSGRVSRVSENAKIVRKVGIGGRRAEVTDYLTSYDAGPSPGLQYRERALPPHMNIHETRTWRGICRASTLSTLLQPAATLQESPSERN